LEIALIHAMKSSIDVAERSFARGWPEAGLRHFLDEGLASAFLGTGTCDRRLFERLLRLGQLAAAHHPDAILFTCSAAGSEMEDVRRKLSPLPVYLPYQAMIAEAAAHGGKVALVAWFEPTLASMPARFPADMEIIPIFVRGAQAAHAAGDWDRHDSLVAEATLSVDADAFALAQFSIARAAPLVRACTGKPVLTTPDSAVDMIRRELQA
jgi:hypothetical protein